MPETAAPHVPSATRASPGAPGEQHTPAVVAITPPPQGERAQRNASFAPKGEKRNRHHLPLRCETPSPVGYRRRVALTLEEAAAAMPLLAMAPPTAFVPRVEAGPAVRVTEGALFEETSLGVLSARQSTNFRGHRQITLGPESAARLEPLLARLTGREGPALSHATHAHVVLSRAYRTPFTLLLTFLGHRSLLSLATVPLRALGKLFQDKVDIPTIDYLRDLHLGVLAEAIERAAVIASSGARRALVHAAPFADPESRARNAEAISQIEALCGLTGADRRAGWRVALIAQVGAAIPAERIALEAPLARKLGANLLAFRSERAMPGVNADDKAQPQYAKRQSLGVPQALYAQATRASVNALARWTGLPRDRAKALMLFEGIDPATGAGRARLEAIKQELSRVSDRCVADIPLWCDLATLRALSSNAARGKKAFALAGDRVVVGGLSRPEVVRAGLSWERAVRAVGAAAARAACYLELMGVTGLPADCDLLGGVCMMAGPVNQNDIGKTFYGGADMLSQVFPGREPTSLLVITFKAKTVADPIGNEEQLQNPAKQGALVDLRPGPHEVALVEGRTGAFAPMRLAGTQTNEERAFHDVGNFTTAPDGAEIPGNRGAPWPAALRDAVMWGAG